ncbi:interaptin-like [Micropterus dolomieu]|uniref:interaptin-like n=1 Tax=Micropterus dolomieu TaxID=147949 RepID=UPI001E8D4833|nr:interaptin-like [Micropterus dolomieu]
MKTDNDKGREMLLNEKDIMDREREELKIREDQLMSKMKSIETLRAKLLQQNVKISEGVKYKVDRLKQNNEDVLMLYTVLEQKLGELDKQKESVAGDTEILERERESLLSMLSDMDIQREHMENMWKQKFEMEKQNLGKLKAELKRDREDLNRRNELLNKEKVDCDQMRSDMQTQTDLLEQEKQDIKEERDKKKTMDGELSELERHDLLTHLMNSNRSQRAKLLNQTIHIRNNMEQLEQKTIDIIQLNSILEHTCDDLEQQINKVIGYYELMQREKKQVVTVKFDKAVQTDGVAESQQQQDIVKRDLNKLKKCESENDQDVRGSDVTILTKEFVNQWKLDDDKLGLCKKGKYLKTERKGLLMVVEGEKVENEQKQKLGTLSELVADHKYFTGKKMSKRDCLRNIWKDTKMERKEIDQTKRWGHEMTNNLEKRLKVINKFLKRTWLQKEQEPWEKAKLEQGLSKDTTSQSDHERDRTSLDKIYTELQQLKLQMLNEIEKLHVKEKVSRTTSDKANQTFKGDTIIGHTSVQITEQASAKMYQGQMKVEKTEAAPETTSGLLFQLRHYCSRCCCPCGACCKVCPEEK